MIKPTPQLSVVAGASQLPSRATAALLEKLRQAVLMRLEPVCAETITKCDDALFDMGQNSKGASAAAYMDAMREIRRERGPMELLFRNHINSSFHEFQQTPGSAAVSGDKQALSLVAEEDLEEQLAGEQTANAIHRRFKQLLEPIAGGLSRIAITINPMFDQANSPVGPERLVGAFRAALTGFSAPTEVKLVLAKLYERQLMPALEVLYPEIHRILGEAGYISGVAPKPQSPAEQHAQQQAQQQAQVAAILGEQVQAQQQYMRASGIPLPPHFFGYSGYQGTESEESVLNSLHDLLLAWRKVQRPDYAAIYQPPAAPSRPALTPNEMLSVLGLFQVDLPVGLKTALQSTDNLAQQIKRELITGAAALGISQHDAHIGDAEEDAIDVVGMMFEVFLDDRDIDPVVRDNLARLLVPYVKVALIDRRLFLHKTHPARKLLNAISEACQGNHGEGPNERELLQKVESVTERLVAGFSEDMGIFDTLEAELRGSIEQYKKRAELAERRVTESQRGKERLEEARLRAEGLLSQRLQNRQVTETVQEDLHRYWSHHYAVVFLRENGEGEGCTQALHTLDQMLALADAAFHTGGLTAQGAPDALQPGLLTMLASSGLADASAAECARVISQHLLQPPMKVVAPSRAPAPVTAPTTAVAQPSNDTFGNALDESMASLSATVDRMMLSEADPVAAQTAAPAAQPAPEAAAAAPAAAAAAQAPAAVPAPAKEEPAPPAPMEFDHVDVERMRKLTVGTWVEFIGDDERITPGKLSWISPISQRMLFVNRRGARMHVASVEELAAMMKAGHLRLRVADTAFEQAMQQVLGKLKEGAGAVDPAAVGAG